MSADEYMKALCALVTPAIARRLAIDSLPDAKPGQVPIEARVYVAKGHPCVGYETSDGEGETRVSVDEIEAALTAAGIALPSKPDSVGS